jgi:SOS-response transcriptional repressor LexA
MSLDEYLKNKEAAYLLQVKGDSMSDAGILPGNLVIVERTNAPKVRNIVIAEVDGAWRDRIFKRDFSAPLPVAVRRLEQEERQPTRG